MAPDALDGEDGEVLDPADEDAAPDGEAVEPEGEVVLLRDAALSPRSQALSTMVPRATETASASVLNLMKASVVGVTVAGSKVRACYLPPV